MRNSYLNIDIEKKGKVKSKASAYKALQSEMLVRGYRQNWKIIADKEKAEGSIFNPLRKKYYRFSIRLDGENTLENEGRQGNNDNRGGGNINHLQSTQASIPDDYLERLIENQNKIESKFNQGQSQRRKNDLNKPPLEQKISQKDLRLYQDLIKSKQQELGITDAGSPADFVNTRDYQYSDEYANENVNQHSKKYTVRKKSSSLPSSLTNTSQKYFQTDTRKQLLDFLEEKDFSKKFIQDIFYDLDKNRSLVGLDFPSTIETVIDIIVNKITYSGFPKKYDGIPNLLFFVGPTGVGKTTTICKLVHELMYLQKQKICLASYDMVKLAGTEQLKQYANMIRAPYQQIVKIEDIKEIYHTHSKDYQYICIDFAGASSKDQERLLEMQKMVAALSCPSEVNLCLNAGIKYRDMLKIGNAFSGMKYNRVIITKTDDTECLGTILSFLWEIEISVSCLTNGQEIPRDIIFLNPEKIKRNFV